MYLVLTTLLHSLILLVPLHSSSPLVTLYSYCIGCTTLVSALWHWNQEPKNFLYALDYGLTALWTVLDLTLAVLKWDFGVLLQVAYLNVGTFAHHELQKPYTRDRNAYIYYHSAWHLLSVTKGIAVAFLLQCPNQGSQEVGNLPNNSLILYENRICQI